MARLSEVKIKVKTWDFNENGHLICECGSNKMFVSKTNHEGYETIVSKCVGCWNLHMMKLDKL